MSWKAIARSTIGTSHQKQEIKCQDSGNWQIFDDLIVGAVADGAGSAKYSDIGAKLAVDMALDYFESIDKEKLNDCSGSEARSREIFTEMVQKVIKDLQKRATEKGYSLNDLACTLLVVAATPDWLIAMQIGDGFIVVRDRQQEPQLLFPPDKGEYLNETTFVTSSNALQMMRVCARSSNPEFICASTDGLERLAIRTIDWTPFTPFFQPLEEYLRETENPEEEDDYLMSFLNSERLNARTDDDKTLFLGLLT